MNPSTLVLQRPVSNFMVGEAIEISVFPPRLAVEVNVVRMSDGARNTVELTSPKLSLRGEFFCASEFIVYVVGHDSAGDSNRVRFVIHDECKDLTIIDSLRSRDGYLSAISDVSMRGVRTLTDPWALPFNCPDNPVDRKWFPTPCFEGQTSLLNEECDYYVDPIRYYSRCIDRLIEQDVKFITWHDVLDGYTATRGAKVALIQFDIDAGMQSMRALAEVLIARGVVATAMIHVSARFWYEYDLTKDDKDFFVSLEKDHSWAIGYHNNTLTNVVGYEALAEYPAKVLAEASDVFREDVELLREDFQIRSFTHHGGNVMNLTMGEGPVDDVTCVDKAFSKELWGGVRRSYSDGGFQSRPTVLSEYVESMPEGISFFRNHPFKYGNYSLDEPDALPIEPRGSESDRFLEKQERWLSSRFSARDDRALSYDSADKPLSDLFSRSERLEALIRRFRSKRRESFLLDYPHTLNDPRVFWWRLLFFHAPEKGRLLNVGALPPEQKEEATSFLSDKIDFCDIDIDGERKPTIVGDFVRYSAQLNSESFECICLFGLPYFGDPKAAVDAVVSGLAPGGVGLIGFCDDTHPKRGGLWNPETRPVWRAGMKIDEIMTLNGKLWSFSDDSVAELLEGIDKEILVESAAHYWFVKITNS